MATQLIVAAAVYLAITALCFWWPAGGRRAVGVLFAVIAVAVSGAITVFAPGLFVVAGQAPWAWYRSTGLALTQPAPRVFGAPMVVLEIGLAVLVLSWGRAARLGRLGVAAFLVGIAPLGVHTLANPVLAVGALYLATLNWPPTAFAGRQSAEPVTSGRNRV